MSFESRIDRVCALLPQAPRDAIVASRLLFRVAQRLEALVDKKLEPLTLTMRQYLVLAMLFADDGEPSRPSELGDIIDATRTQMTRVLDSLEARGLLIRTLSQQDRRSFQLALTPAGLDLVKEAAPRVHEAYRECWGVLEPEALQDLSAQLGLLNRALTQAAP